MGRPAYKALYLSEQRWHRATNDRAAAFDQELARIYSVLAHHGERVLRDIPADDPNGSPVGLSALDYEAASAAMRANSRMPLPFTVRPSLLTWRGRRLLQVKE